MNGRMLVVLALVAVGGVNVAYGAECETVMDVLTSYGNFTTLVAAIESASMEATFGQPSAKFTILAPVDSAFEELLAATGLSDDLLLGNLNLLSSILKSHVLTQVVEDPVALIDAKKPQKVASVEKDTTVTFVPCPSPLPDSAVCVYTSPITQIQILEPMGIEACKSVVYPINGILLPKTAMAAVDALLNNGAAAPGEAPMEAPMDAMTPEMAPEETEPMPVAGR